MTNTTIDRVRIKGVRGIRTALDLDLVGGSLLLRGDNGTGKSSIAQALRWALIGSINGAAGPRIPADLERHRLESDPDAAEVVIHLAPSGRIVLRGGHIVDAETDSDGRAYIDACVRSNPFLRRDELLGFLNLAPGERFKYLERFLDLDRVDQLLVSLAEAAKREEASTKEAASRCTDIVRRAHACLQTAGPTPTSLDELLDLLAREGERLGLTTEFAGHVALAELRSTLSKTKLDPRTATARAELVAALTQIDALALPAVPHPLLDALRAAEAMAEESALASLLGEALAVVEADAAAGQCPLCEQSVDRAAVAARLRTRLGALEDVRRLNRQVTLLAEAWASFSASLDAAERVVDEGRTSTPRRPHAGRSALEELARLPAEALVQQTEARRERLRTAIEDRLKQIPDELRASDLAKLAAAVDVVDVSRNDLEDADASVARHSRRARELRTIEKAVSDARKDTALAILTEIQDDVARYYEFIHPSDAPDEVTGAPSIKVKRHGAGTAHVRGRFNDVEVDDPRHVYSDGHLDTVGICVFLALRKRSSATAKLLVLDDIVLSIDLGHAERLIKLLRKEFDDHQILLLSHNELFIRSCRVPFSHARQLDIVRWTLEDGPRISGRASNVDALREKLENCGSAEQLAGAMRPVLDDLLHEASNAFGVSLPPRGRGLTVEQYWGPLRKKLGELTKAKVLPPLDDVFEAIGSPNFLRNALGAHLNLWALEIPLGQVQRVAEGVLLLAERITCSVCKTIPTIDARGHRYGFACGCHGHSPSLPHQPSTDFTKDVAQ